MDAIPPLAMLACGLFIAPIRRVTGIGAVWFLLAVMAAILCWLSARSWDAALQAGFRVVDYGPIDERWAIIAGLLAAGTVATHFAIRDVANEALARISVVGSVEKAILEAFAESGAAFLTFLMGGIGAGADISRPLAASLATYVVFLIWSRLLRNRVRHAD